MDPTLARAEEVIERLPEAAELTGVELLALFERRAVIARQNAAEKSTRDGSTDAMQAGRAASLAITYGQEARQRYTEALCHLRGTHNPVDIEDLDRKGVSAPEERQRFEDENVEGEPDRNPDG